MSFHLFYFTFISLFFVFLCSFLPFAFLLALILLSLLSFILVFLILPLPVAATLHPGNRDAAEANLGLILVVELMIYQMIYPAVVEFPLVLLVVTEEFPAYRPQEQFLP